MPALPAAEARLGREVNPSVYPIKECRAKLRKGIAFLKRVLAGPKFFRVGDDSELGRRAR